MGKDSAIDNSIKKPVFIWGRFFKRQNLFSLKFLFLFVVLCLLIIEFAFAQPVSINNPSFEDDVLSEGEWTADSITGWIVENSVAGAYYPVPDDYPGGIPDGEKVENGTEGTATTRKTKPSYRYVCPTHIPELAGTLQDLSTAAFEAVNAVDMARVDFRCDADGMPHLLEIDTLPSMEQEHSRYVRMAEAGGVPFFDLVNTILGLAVNRYHLEVGAPCLLDGENQEAHRLAWSSAISL